MSQRPIVAVVGGGITGLAAAHRLHELARERGTALDVRLFEAGEHLGGVIRTEQRDGFTLEWGPDSFITDKPWALDLCKRIGLDDELMSTGSVNRRSFVAHNGRLQPVPEGFQLLAPARVWPFLTSPIFSWPGKVRIGWEYFVPPRREDGDESLADFVERRLGREALTRMAQPMVAGIYGADPRRLSLEATLPRFRQMERQHGGVLRAMRARSRQTRGGAGSNGTSGARYGLFVSFKRGMQTLPDALIARLSEGCARTRVRVTSLERVGEAWRVTLDAGEPVLADAVCLALPAYRAGELLRPLDAPLADLLDGVPYAASATVNLAYNRADVPHPMDGFGFVVPSTERRSILGCTFAQVKFPGRAPEGKALLRAFVGEGPVTAGDDAAVVETAFRDLSGYLGLTKPPLWSTVHRHARSMAQYEVGHLERVAEMERRLQAWPGLALAGNAYRGIGIPDCVHSAEQAAAALVERLLPAQGASEA